jgi:predicted methyltransferase
LIRFARVDTGNTVLDVYPGDGDWTRLFVDIVGAEGRVYGVVSVEVAHFKNDPVGRMRALSKEPGRANVEAVSAYLVAMQEVTQPADVLWLHFFYHDLHTTLIEASGATAAQYTCKPRLRAALTASRTVDVRVVSSTSRDAGNPRGAGKR